jgi:two-component system phosphate regulon sensor histidine kinase PhoR
MLNQLIVEVLKKNKLDTIYHAGIRKENEAKFEYLTPGTDKQVLAKANVRTRLLEDKFNKPYELLVYVPGTFTSVIRSLMLMMVSSLVIILVLLMSYIYFVRTILAQRRLSEMKNTFINNITHEFRTPITNISLAVENWRDSKNNDGLYAGIIEEENKRMERNVEQILQLAVLEADASKKYFSKINITHLIEDAVRAFSIQIQNTGGRISTQYNASNPYLYCNEQQIRNMLQNLIDNAIKYRSVHQLVIQISTFDTGSHFVIQVEDNGIGMSHETQKFIFNRFFRGNTGDRHDVKGFGLGMSYVKHIVDAHEGEINIKSKIGRGTKITIYLPKTLETI